MPRVPKTTRRDSFFHRKLLPALFLQTRTWRKNIYDDALGESDFTTPARGELMRGSLETHDSAKAELLRQRVELEATLLDPRFQAAAVPENLPGL